MDAARPHQDLTQWFCAILSAEPDPPPERVNSFMNLIYTHSPQNIVPFNLTYRTPMERWNVKGLRIGIDEKDKKAAKRVTERSKNVVLVSGTKAQERATVGVSLYVAAVLSRRPLSSVDVSVIPLLYPKEYETYWRAEQVQAPPQYPALAQGSLTYQNNNNMIPPDRDFFIGPIRNYVLRQGKNFFNITMELGPSGSVLHTKPDPFSALFKRAGQLLPNLPPSGLSMYGGSLPLLDPFLNTPTYVIELRDKNQALDEEQIAVKGEEVLAAIKHLTEEDGCV